MQSIYEFVNKQPDLIALIKIPLLCYIGIRYDVWKIWMKSKTTQRLDYFDQMNFVLNGVRWMLPSVLKLPLKSDGLDITITLSNIRLTQNSLC